ncbi:MAG: hypothetical protein L6R38_004287 [Xanthoria sp. 2 TBL-2021]|nr:MAG: hypothetical protein L6R38_004287 [Xanthoria sp. 2 TBL-2021]
MANAFGDSTMFGPDASLTLDEQSLLQTALAYSSSNKSKLNGSFGAPKTARGSGAAVGTGSLRPAQPVMDPQNNPLYQSPIQDVSNIGVDSFGVDDSPFIDGHDFEDGNFDWDNSGDLLFGDLPERPDHEDGDIHDKRKNSHDDDDEDGQNKRREGNEKNNKKPGRKPLNNSEPTTKRKAQNRAAQRAFRERKERHLKDLETKVEDLEKASEATNHENGRLRATVERLNTEVKEYRKRLSLTNPGYSPPTALAPQLRNNNDNDFHFAFPKFGDLPGSTFMSNGSLTKVGAPAKPPSRTPSGNNPIAPGIGSSDAGNGRSTVNGVISPTSQNRPSSTGSTSMAGIQASPTGFHGSGAEDLNGLFSPSTLQSASRSNSSDYMFPVTNKSAAASTKQTSRDSPAASNKQRASSASIAASPSISSVSHTGMDSSTGTTPEPSSDSQEYRKPTEGTLNTINEEAGPKFPVEDKRTFCDKWATACGNTLNPVPRAMSQMGNASAPPSSVIKSPSNEVSGIDWMARQNGGQFDPELFGDYRDTQTDLWNSDFFSEAFLNQDFNTPFNMPEDIALEEPKKDLMQQVEEQKEADHDEVVPAGPKQYLTCDKLWDRVQQSEKAQSGEADMDNLCSQLKAKAKCSGSGAVIEQKDVDAILGPPPEEQVDFLKMFK